MAQQPKTTTYDQAMENSWPHAGFLIELMDSVAKSKRERTTVKALRLSRELLDRELAKLQEKRALLDARIVSECSHPPEHLVVNETELTDGSKKVVHFSVVCGCCHQALRHHTRET